MLQKNLPELRRKKGLSQESFAELFGVTRQSVQKWESGDTQPTIDRLLEIADYFRISVDALLGRQKTDVETLRTSDVPVPKYDTLDTFDDYSAQLANEEYQCRDEGRHLIDPRAGAGDRAAPEQPFPGGACRYLLPHDAVPASGAGLPVHRAFILRSNRGALHAFSGDSEIRPFFSS